MASSPSQKLLPPSSSTDNLTGAARMPPGGSGGKREAPDVDDEGEKNKKLKSINGTADQSQQEKQKDFDSLLEDANFSDKQKEFFQLFHSQMQIEETQMQSQLSQMQARVAKTEGRLDQVFRIISPITKYALFETSVYAYVKRELPSSINEVLKKNVLHGISLMCANVLCRLLSEQRDISWRPKQKRSFTLEARVNMLKAGLKGLLEFVKSAKTEDVKGFVNNFVDRNTLSHDGDHLDAYNTPPTRLIGEPLDFSVVRQEVKSQRTIMTQDASRGYTEVSSFKESVENVVDAMKTKRAPLLVSSGDIDQIVEELKKASK